MKINKFLLLGMLWLTACGRVEVTIQQTATSVPTITTGTPTDTAIVVTATEPVRPTATIVVVSPSLPPATATQVQAAAPTRTESVPATATEKTVRIFLIAVEDNGRSGTLVGCGDSAIPVTVTIPPTQGVLRAALGKLLSAKQQYYGESGLYNALYQSNLEVASVTIEQGKAIIHLTGTIMLGGTCDAPRLEAQIEQTALQFSTVGEVAVFVNDVPLEEVLSQK
jgi:hypothetical protein